MTANPVSQPFLVGLILPVILFSLLVIREFGLLSADPNWKKVSRCLLLPILALFVMFFFQVLSRFESFSRQEEYRGSLIQGLDVSNFLSSPATPTPYQPTERETQSIRMRTTTIPSNDPKQAPAHIIPPELTPPTITQGSLEEFPPSIPLVTGLPIQENTPRRMIP
jgi:hypothetical protein